jgi:hypothetical protein
MIRLKLQKLTRLTIDTAIYLLLLMELGKLLVNTLKR